MSDFPFRGERGTRFGVTGGNTFRSGEAFKHTHKPDLVRVYHWDEKEEDQQERWVWFYGPRPNGVSEPRQSLNKNKRWELLDKKDVVVVEQVGRGDIRVNGVQQESFLLGTKEDDSEVPHMPLGGKTMSRTSKKRKVDVQKRLDSTPVQGQTIVQVERLT